MGTDDQTISQDEIIERLATYIAMVIAAENKGEPDLEDQLSTDALLVGLSIAIAIASGATGPATAIELAEMGGCIASLALG